MPILIDLDSIVVNMTPVWLRKYYEKTGDLINEEEITTWEFDAKAKYKDAFHDILGEPGFFFDLEPMPGAIEYFSKLMEKKLDIVILTQPPRKSDYAIRDKKAWVSKYLPKFELKDMIFAHRKELVQGQILFDDSPLHLKNHKFANSLTATITYPYNKDVKVDWRFDKKQTAWQQFYENVCNLYGV